jgi:hypothetical protein
MIKTYWQAMDGDGKAYLFHGDEKPTCDDGEYYSDNNGNYSRDILFPVPLKPLQLATITVNENGTWSWEIEREEGVYMAKNIAGDCFLAIYERGVWRQKNTGNELKPDYGCTFSPTRIPDECII